jgi:hypothetical protein
MVVVSRSRRIPSKTVPVGVLPLENVGENAIMLDCRITNTSCSSYKRVITVSCRPRMRDATVVLVRHLVDEIARKRSSPFNVTHTFPNVSTSVISALGVNKLALVLHWRLSVRERHTT